MIGGSSHHPHLAPLYIILTTPIPATSTYVLTADSNMRVVPRMRAPAHGRRDHRLLSSPLFFFVFFNPRISVTIQVYPNWNSLWDPSSDSKTSPIKPPHHITASGTLFCCCIFTPRVNHRIAETVVSHG